MDETPTGRGASEGLWKMIALMLFSFMCCAVFMGLPAGAKLTGEYALRVKLEAAEEEIRRLKAEHDTSFREMKTKLGKIESIDSNLQWMVDWIKAAGRK